MEIILTQIDTACMLIDLNGYRILTDPAFDDAGGTYQSGSGRTLQKLKSPAIHPQQLGAVDLVLLSHDQHKDNFDNKGQEFSRSAPMLISTPEALQRLAWPNITGINEWESVGIDTERVPALRVTATPCQHGSDEELHRIAGHVIGFVLEWEGQKNGALYISGDTVFFKGIEEIAKRYTIDTAILHMGRAGFPAQIGDRYLTFTTKEAVLTANLLKANKIIPTHNQGWAHFLENPTETHKQLLNAGLGEKLIWLEPGKPVTLKI